MEGSDKPFQCPKCKLRFASSDRLSVHLLTHIKSLSKTKLKVKIPGSVSDNVDDQTPTPSSFLKTADVNGSPLFQDLNPFDRDFKMASTSRQTSVVEQHPEVGSTTGTKHQISILETPKIEMEEAGFPKVYQPSGRMDNEEVPGAKPVSVITSAVEDINRDNVGTSTISSASTSPQNEVPQSASTASLLQNILNQLKAQENQENLTNKQQQLPIQQQQQQQQQYQFDQQPELQHDVKDEGIKTEEKGRSSQSQEVKDTTSQDHLREQLKSLIKSGQIRIQIASYPSSTKVQASIVGNVATISKPEATVQQQPSVSVVQQTQQQHQLPPRSIAPKSQLLVGSATAPTQSVVSSSASSKVAPMSVISNPSPGVLHASDMVMLPGTNLQISKEKLKQVIQQTSDPAQIQNLLSRSNILLKPQQSSSSAIMSATTSNTHFLSASAAAGTGRGSQQGKYKDIVLTDEFGDEIPMKRKNRATSDDASPDEKRQRFLERNRAAASRCRQKRKIWVDQLEQKSDELVSTNVHLMGEIQSLRSEVAQLKALLLAHKDCPVTQQQKALVNQIANAGTYVAVSDGQLIAIHQLPPTAVREASDEEVASSALTDMAARATIELEKKVVSGVITVQSSADGAETKIS